MMDNIDNVDRQLGEWINSVLENMELSFGPPADNSDGHGVSLYLMELAHSPLPAGQRKVLRQISLRYLVTSWAESPLEAHRILGKLIFAAMENAEFEVEPGTAPIDVWKAFGIAPRPSFILRRNLRVERPETVAPMVRVPMTIENSPMEELQGLVLGPGEIPIMGALVEFPTLQRHTYTDSKGQFVFPAVPGHQTVKELRVTARGWATMQLQPTIHDDELLIIRIDAAPED